MSSARERLRALGVGVPNVYLPGKGVDHHTWAVVACDQYSSERAYWDRIDSTVGGAPSALKLIFPECYLEDKDKEARIASIRASMRAYLDAGFLESQGEGFVLVERTTPYEAQPRVGLMITLDLEKYRYGKDSKSLVRPTEGTIVERLPPRMAIRRGSPLELPHIMVLIDDPARRAIEPLYEKRRYFTSLYDFDLMENSGHVRGWHVRDESALAGIADALESLANPEAFKARYGSKDTLLFAVGDGNHSLATAKAIWEELKASFAGRPDEDALLENHPARFAMVELLNIYNEGLPFHPIHRVLFNVDEKAFFSGLKAQQATLRRTADAASAFAECDAPAQDGSHTIAFCASTGAGLLTFPHPDTPLAAGSIQHYLDGYLKSHPETSIDYIHGSGSLRSLGEKPGNIGLYLPPVDKGSFFETVIRDGVMPRKTFSMGEAPEKRFYMEARRID